jgi:light-regulated signal transduction histidine kinase (bacteriophytochrome)
VLQLVKATEEIGAGNLDYRIEATARDEIGQLAAAFDDMTAKLKQAEGELRKHREHLEELVEELVEERAAELKRTNEELEAEIVERKRAEEQLKRTMADLERSNRELEQFAYVASHDLQEPLRMVSSYTQLLARRYQDQLDQDAHDFITYAVEGAERMQRLINDLLTYSRVGTRGKPFGKTDCQRALQDTLANLQTAIEETHATVTHDPLPIVLADEPQLVQVLQNLVSNAIKFHAEAPPRVHIGAQRQDGEWVFSVSDNGIGIDPQYHERIFVIFQRLHSGDEYPGTGIGLALCKRIVERHGGRIWVESDLGEGATFCFTIPDREVGKDE